MPDNQFDDFVGRNLSDLSVLVPEGAWERLADKQFDLHCKQNLQHMQVPVAEEIWTRISDTRFDQHISDQLSNYIAPVPAGSFEQLDDTRLDQFFGASLVDREVPVGEEQWDKIAEAMLDQHSGKLFDNFEVPVAEGLWGKIADRQFDQHFGSNLADATEPVSTGMWDKIADTQFDQFFQTQLGNFEAPVAADMWDRVKPKEKDDRKFFYWMPFPMAAAIIGALFLGGIFASYVLYQNYFHNQETKSGTQVLRDSSHEKNVITPEPAQAPVTIPITDPNNATIPPAANNSSINNVVPPQNTTLSDNQSGKHLPKAGGLFISKRKNNPSIQSGFQVADAAKKPSGSENGGTQDKVLAEDILPVYANTNPSDKTEGFRKLSFPYPTIAMERNGYPNNQEITALNKQPINLPKIQINCPTARSKNKWDELNKDWYADTYISPDYSLQTVNNISASQQYLKQKDSTERMQLGFTAGVRLVKPLNNHLHLTTGLQYSQINQNYVYRSENEIKLTTVITQRTIITAPGVTVVVRDTSIVQNIGFKNKVEKNRHRSIDIPILLGYQFGRGSVKVGVNAGVILNVSSWYEGVILDSSLAVVPVQKGSQVYKSKLGLGLYAGINVTKELSDDMQLFVEPYYKHSIDNITSGSMPYQQKFGTAGVLMGVRWSLNRK
jgi:hypothetical protein